MDASSVKSLRGEFSRHSANVDAQLFDLGSAANNERGLLTHAMNMGTIDARHSIQALTGAAAIADRLEAEREEKDKRNFEDQAFNLMLQQAREASERLGREIADLEASFEAEHGDAWREVLANEILDPDIVPQRQEGESISDYRDRLEVALQKEMLDEDGQIKEEYKDGPYSKYAIWAQKEYSKNKVDDYISKREDPSLSTQQKLTMDEEFSKTATFAEISIANTDASNGHGSPVLDEAIQNHVSITVAKTTANDLANF